MYRFVFTFLIFCIPFSVHADLFITEVMFDPSGADTGREWIEIENRGASPVDVSEWKLFEENVNHKISAVGSSATLSPGAFAIITTDPSKFSIDYPSVSVLILDASFSLKNTGETLALKRPDSSISDQVFYDPAFGGNNDGTSLHKSGSTFVVSAASPGSSFGGQSSSGNGNTNSTTTQATSTTETQTQNQTSSSTGATFTSSPQYVPPPNFYATIIGPKLVIAGVETVFEAKAFNSSKKEMTDVNFGWNFGDGSTALGSKVLHRYRYPGQYHIALDSSNYQYMGPTEFLTIEVIAPELKITPLFDEYGIPYITVENPSSYELDISRFILEQGGTYGLSFVIPKNTRILPGGIITFPSEVTRLFSTTTEVALLFPNRTVASQFTTPSSSKVALSSETQVVTVFYSPSVSKKEITPLSLVATTSSLISENVLAEEQGAFTGGFSGNAMFWWLAALFGVIVVGIASVFVIKLFPAENSIITKAKEYEIIEET